jgi:GntR family transcriptional regulator, transcriptional repressor for pyruvate dehydrogenase complex
MGPEGIGETSHSPAPGRDEGMRGAPSSTLSRRSLAEDAAAAILASLRAAGLRKGDALPPLTHLAAQFGVSRTVAREALAKLSEQGAVERGRGRRWILRASRPAKRGASANRQGGSVAPVSLAEQAAAAVLELIRSEKLGEGDALPSSRQLAERFDVSILVIREALADLGARGILHRRQGREAVVALPSHELVSSILNFRAYLERIDVVEFQSCRAPLEIHAAELAAGRGASAEKRDQLIPFVAGMRDAASEDVFNDNDLAFHLAIARLCGNRAIELLLASLNDLVRTSLALTYRRVFAQGGGAGIESAIANHERIADAIIKGSERAAARAMKDHFAYVFEQFGRTEA